MKRAKKYFMKWVINDGKGFLDKIERISDMKALNGIVVRCDKDTLIWHNDKEEKETICANVGINPITFDRCLYRLVKAGIIERLMKGKYRLNEEYITFGREVND